MGRNIIKIIVCSGLCGLLGACATIDSDDYDRGVLGDRDSLSDHDLTAGSVLGASLTATDRRAINSAFRQAIENSNSSVGSVNTFVPWQSKRASGSVKIGSFYVGNLLANPDDVLPAPLGLELRYQLETEQGAFVLTKNSNIRLGPSTNFDVVDTLPSGTGVMGVGRVLGQPWMLISLNGDIIGYVFEKLMVKAPGADFLELAGGPVRTPIACRSYTMTLELENDKDEWDGVACDYGRGFAPQRRVGPTRLQSGASFF